MEAAEFSFRLDKFFSWFRLRLGNLVALGMLPPNVPADPRSAYGPEQHILLAAGLDALANYWGRCYGRKGLTHRERMGEFLRLHGGSTWGLVAGPELRRRAAREQPAWHGPLTRIVGVPETTSRVRKSSDDVMLDDIVQRAAASGVVVDAAWIRRSLYGEVLYEYYRCNWLHELEASEKLGSELFSSIGEPHYENRLFHDDEGNVTGKEYRPVFPRSFLIETYERAVASFEAQCNADGVDPCTGERFLEFSAAALASRTAV